LFTPHYVGGLSGLIRIEGAAMTTIRKEMPAPELDKDEFKRRYRERFYDPAFDSMQIEIDRLAEIAWGGYENSRKSPRTERAGEGFADPDYQLAIEWRETSRRAAATTRSQLASLHSADQRRDPQRAHVPRGVIEDLAASGDRPGNFCA
jgi:hypothetical protein